MMKEDSLFRGEIIRYQEQLKQFRISFHQLSVLSPIEPSVRNWCKGVAYKLIELPTLSDRVLQTRKLPYRELVKQYLFNKSNLKRYHKYILAIFLLKHGNYQHLSEYLSFSL